jgi:uncharacterized protein YraI
MVRKIGLLSVVIALVVALVPGVVEQPAAAQGDPHGWTAYDLNMRAGPGSEHAVIVALPSGTALVFEGRNGDASWMLARTLDGAHRGWLSSLYLTFAPGMTGMQFPVTGEIVQGAAAAPADPAPQADDSAPQPAPAAGGGTVRTAYAINVRSGPGANYAALGSVAGGVVIVPEARNGDASWVLGHTEDGSVRGWLSSLYLNFSGMTAASLPYSEEIVLEALGIGSASQGGHTEIDDVSVPLGRYEPALIENIDLYALPVVPNIPGRVRDIFLAGQRMGRDRTVVAKVGDCSSEHFYFLSEFGWGSYNLGSYGSLQDVINHFGESLAYNSEATHNGYNSNTVQAPEFASPAVCQSGESPLECEYRIHQPSVSVIMFGTSDLISMSPFEFDFFMRILVSDTIDAGVIPVLSTFPGNLGDWPRTIVYNKIVARIAMDYGIPLINLWLALEDLPNHGLEPDGFHLGEPITNGGDLSATNLQSGYGVRNLVTLQTLDKIWREAMQ